MGHLLPNPDYIMEQVYFYVSGTLQSASYGFHFSF